MAKKEKRKEDRKRERERQEGMRGKEGRNERERKVDTCN